MSARPGGAGRDNACALCAIRDGDSRYSGLEVGRGETLIIALNLRPYNPGHLMIFPRRHLTDIRQLSEAEVLELHSLQTRTMLILEQVYNPSGFNTGFNLGHPPASGIEHIRCHLVPRHRNEIGLLEMISEGSRVLVEDPLETLQKLRQAFAASAAGLS